LSAPIKRTVFISHSSVNKKVTDELYQALTGRFHLACWMDNFDLHTAEGPFLAQIVNALRSSSLLVMVDSPAARASAYVQREIQTAKDLQMPVQRCSIDEDQAPLLRKIRILWLALTIQLRLARAFVVAALTLFLLLAAMVVFIFLFGTRVVPVLAHADLRDLPAAFRSTPTSTMVPTPSDPKVAAPFHFKPDTILLQEDFNNPEFENSFNNQTMGYGHAPSNPQVNIGQQNGSLVIFFPAECFNENNFSACELELDSNELDAGGLQYFGFRARTAARTDLRGVSVSLSMNEPLYLRPGFGWNFTEHAMAFFRSIPLLPEKDLATVVLIDSGWHAYEILRDPQTPAYYYYIDGQLVDIYSPVHAREWDQAPLQLIIYSMIGKVINPSGEEATSTQFEMDELVVGGFNNP